MISLSKSELEFSDLDDPNDDPKLNLESLDKSLDNQREVVYNVRRRTTTELDPTNCPENFAKRIALATKNARIEKRGITGPIRGKGLEEIKSWSEVRKCFLAFFVQVFKKTVKARKGPNFIVPTFKTHQDVFQFSVSKGCNCDLLNAYRETMAHMGFPNKKFLDIISYIDSRITETSKPKQP